MLQSKERKLKASYSSLFTWTATQRNQFYERKRGSTFVAV